MVLGRITVLSAAPKERVAAETFSADTEASW
jgi:hypothetical protein